MNQEEGMADDSILTLGGADVAALLEGREGEVIEAVAEAYKTHARGESSLPHSSFLRFPDSDRDRIIALPAYLGGDFQLAGIKWIASVPGNLERGLERASAVILLNERATGRPTAMLEGSLISARRTAASAALAARELRGGDPPARIGFIGCGPINFQVARHLLAVWPGVRDFVLFDLDPARARAFAERLGESAEGARSQVAASAEELLEASDIVSFGTTAIRPHISDLSRCPADATILHVSLRDLEASVILDHDNVVDDLDHVCRAQTSIHLAAEAVGHRDFVRASIGEILLGTALPKAADRALTIFSPFGLGILDLAVAELVCRRAQEEGKGVRLDHFLPPGWQA
jgi:ornithine cyclodeaminase